jgi:hypothetical protein
MVDELKTRMEKYLLKAKPLFDTLETAQPEKVDLSRAAKEFHEMASAYYSDAKQFYEDGDYAKALAALEYAEGWMDAGKRLGILR